MEEKCSSPDHDTPPPPPPGEAEPKLAKTLTKEESRSTPTADIDRFLAVLQCSSAEPPETIPDSILNLTTNVEAELVKQESGKEPKWTLSLLDDIDRLSTLSAAIAPLTSRITYSHAANRILDVVQRAMSFLEEEFLSLLDIDPDPDPPHTEMLHKIATLMISTGFETECCQVYSIARRSALDTRLTALGFVKSNTDDMQKMPWESLENEIAAWIKAFRHSVTVSFAVERRLCEEVFSDHRALAGGLFSNLARGVIIQLLNFAEAVTTTKRSAEKLFKVLDMYETLRDMMPQMDGLGTAEEGTTDLQSEISSARGRLGEAAVAIFCDLESSIHAEATKNPVPGGAVHPLTRYVMNYIKYASEYKKSLEQVFQEYGHAAKNDENSAPPQFVSQLMKVMDLLHSSLESKSKLYKDPSLSYIFLMNNGRYILQKIKGSADANELLGDPWRRKRSGELRQYHKNYQRETWSKVLGCFREEGLQGKVSKEGVKERLKSFNSMLEEIHKTQSSWVVSDEQLQSELRVSVSAVVVPAYRSFLGRYRQYLKEGRQTQKYIKFAPDDLEAYIDELFDGSHHSSAGRKKSASDHGNNYHHSGWKKSH